MKGSRIMIIATILVSVALAAIAQLVLKAGVDKVGHESRAIEVLKGAASTPLVWVGLVLFGLSALVWLVVLSRTALSFAYPFASLTYAIIVIADRFVLHYEVPPVRWVGVALIISGIVLIATTMGSSVGTKG